MEGNNYCSNCGTELEDNANFCPNCGKDIRVNEQQGSEEMSFSDYNKADTFSKENKLPKFVGHGAVAAAAFFSSILSVLLFEMAANNFLAGLIAVIGGPILIGFITIYAVKLNLLIFDKEKIGWSDILLKNISLTKNISSAIASYFLVFLINLVVVLISAFIMFLLMENYYYDALTFFQIAVAAALLIINSRFVFSQFIVFDQNEKAVNSLKKSFELTKNNILKVIGWIILISLINFIGGAVVIGAFITLPATFYLLTKLYFDLKSAN